MTTARTPACPRPSLLRRAAAVLAVCAGLALIPLPAQASTVRPAAATASSQVLAPNRVAQTALSIAMAQRGKPYAWGAAGPNAFDCSGLTEYAFGRAGIHLPHSSRRQSVLGQPVSRAHLRPGDLVFFDSPVGHVGIYLGHGRMLHAPTTGDVVKITNMAFMYGFHNARRLG